MCADQFSCFGKCSGISSSDSTSLKVCHNRRWQHKVQDLAAGGKTSVDWFFGFKSAFDREWPRGVARASYWLQATPMTVPLCQNCCRNCLANCSGQRLSLSKVGKTTAENRRHSTDDQTQAQHQTTIDAPERLFDALPGFNCRNHYWPVEEHFSWAFSASFSGQLCQHSRWIDCVLPSAKEASYRHRPQSAASGLARTQVKLSWKEAASSKADAWAFTRIKNVAAGLRSKLLQLICDFSSYNLF